MAADRDTAAALAQTYRDPRASSRAFALALAHTQSGRRHLDISVEDAVLFERLASRVLSTDGSLRASPEVLAANVLSQSGLWPHGISGDLPILLVRVIGDDLALVRQALQAQEYWRLKGLSADLVILNEHPVSYLDEMQARLTVLLDNGPWRTWKHQPGGAYLLRADLMGHAERTLLQAVARAVLDGDARRPAHAAGSCAPRSGGAWRRPRSPAFVAVSNPDARRHMANVAGGPVAVPAMMLANTIGGFTDEGRAYAVVLEGDRGDAAALGQRDCEPELRHHRHRLGRSAYVVGNSRQNRLTPFANDPVTDSTGEALFIRDDRSGDAWSPTPGPMARGIASGRFVIEHAAGVSRFSRVHQGIRHDA